ncbi:hypothetical protein NECID01_0106 [Nematocida sp. AWRm77]|nr:hypothetical protein NECID01_0106 [Nematocida sp. AWRm77]
MREQRRKEEEWGREKEEGSRESKEMRREDELEQMHMLRRDVHSLKSIAQELNSALILDVEEIDKTQKHAEYSISALNKTLLRMKRIQNGSFNLVLILTTVALGALLFFVFLFWK